MPKSPEEWLKECDPAQRPAVVFKLFLGYAPRRREKPMPCSARKACGGPGRGEEEVVIGVGGNARSQTDRGTFFVAGDGFRAQAAGNTNRTIFPRRWMWTPFWARKPHVVLVG